MFQNETVECEGCGSRWRVDVDKQVSIIAKLEECPLCESTRDPG